LNGDISHARVQRFLTNQTRTSADLWRIVKPHVRAKQSEDGVLLVDDSIAEKPYTDENEIICRHIDHAQQRTDKGINFVSCLYHNQGISFPVGFELITKTETSTPMPKMARPNGVQRAPKTKSTATWSGKP
jgi:hypothetical protein